MFIGNNNPVNELPKGLVEEAKTVDEAVLRVTYKFLISGGMTEAAAVQLTKTLTQQGYFKEFPCKNQKGGA